MLRDVVLCFTGEGNALFYLFEALVWRFLVLGLLQPVCALLTAGILLPVFSTAVALCE